ncbi:MAG: deoxynucleoside kinase [Lentimicrobium sp.]|jgi:deoxyadenosine/deoxycytidine kinase|nr:deoxynucleoside kinase [Lentimicrobium sp.]MDD2526451.1 deoxynucleoside kinase [Lentimicrobiaceae bacterium]MDD4596414.1 deoxynucleoside kinase [Lentimicrobiaceae bacterium]MDY0026501.1 deoxynucleoside kinase [Lentimicrobium sp.]
MNYNFIAIEGTIGAGKTSLATMLAARHQTRLVLEQFEDNDFLPKFYRNPEKYAFPLELSFLASRFQQMKSEMALSDLFKPVTISDYFINKSLIFARKTLADDEYALYSRLFSIINLSLPKPDLLVYLYLSIDRLKSNIKLRGRPYEQDIETQYLEKIQQGYFEYIRQQSDMRILIIDANELDFVAFPEHFEQLEKMILQDFPLGIHTLKP